MLRDVERSANPWGKPQVERAAWADGLDVRVLEPGDPPPEVPVLGRLRAVVRRAGTRGRALDGEAAAGGRGRLRDPRPARVCTGDPARRMGNEYTFQSYAEQNVETLNEAGVTKIVTSCPHCFNTLGNEYPDFGGTLRGACTTRSCSPSSCATGSCSRRPGRAPDHLPRLLLPGPPQRRARRSRASSSPPSASQSRWRATASGRSAAARAARTCGWRSAAGAINEERVREAAETGAGTLAVACPFCTVMLDDGVRSTGASSRVVDVATLLMQAVERGAKGRPEP